MLLAELHINWFELNEIIYVSNVYFIAETIIIYELIK